MNIYAYFWASGTICFTWRGRGRKYLIIWQKNQPWYDYSTECLTIAFFTYSEYQTFLKSIKLWTLDPIFWIRWQMRVQMVKIWFNIYTFLATLLPLHLDLSLNRQNSKMYVINFFFFQQFLVDCTDNGTTHKRMEEDFSVSWQSKFVLIPIFLRIP